MTFQQYLEQLQAFLKKHPEAAEYEAIYAKDEEGNGFEPVWTTEPCLGHFNDDDFTDEFVNSKKDQEDYPTNAVCIN